MQTHNVRMKSGVIGTVVTSLKSKELLGRYAMASCEVDGEARQVYGIVHHVFEQGELDL